VREKHDLIELDGILFACAGRLVNAWYDTPTKWYPLHIGVGSLLLVSLHWRRRRQQALEDAEAARGDQPSVRLKGPWQVSLEAISILARDNRHHRHDRFTSSGPSLYVVLPVSGDI
jgi:hypothetical protein